MSAQHAQEDWEFDCQAELNRKTFEALEQLENQYQSGRLSESAYRGALRGIDLCVRGLVPEGYALAIDQEIGLLAPKDTRSSVWASSKAVYILSMTIGEDFFVVRTVPAGDGKKVVRGEGTDAVRDATGKFHNFEKKLAAAGYKKL